MRLSLREGWWGRGSRDSPSGIRDQGLGIRDLGLGNRHRASGGSRRGGWCGFVCLLMVSLRFHQGFICVWFHWECVIDRVRVMPDLSCVNNGRKNDASVYCWCDGAGWAESG